MLMHIAINLHLLGESDLKEEKYLPSNFFNKSVFKRCQRNYFKFGNNVRIWVTHPFSIT